MLDFLNQKQIKLGSFDENKTKDFLKNRTYFFKLMAYRKNFINIKGDYVNLTFDELVDISNIDMRLRYIMFHLCLDIEHALKTKFINEIIFRYKDDGYQFLEKYIDQNPNPGKLRKKLNEQVSRTNQELYENHCKQLPLWIVVECCEFGILESMLTFYLKQHPDSELNFLVGKNTSKNILLYVRNIRNKAAHNSVILNSITKNSGIKLTGYINNFTSNFLSQVEMPKTLRKGNCNIGTIHDLTTLLAVYDELIDSPKMKAIRYDELKGLIRRAYQNKHFYIGSSVERVFKYFFVIIKHLCWLFNKIW